MLDEARARRAGGRYHLHDYHEPLPARLGRFDAVVAASCLDFCRDLDRVLAHLAAAMTPGARLFFTVNERRPGLAWHDRRRRLLAPDAFPGLWVWFWTFEECARALARASLEPIRYEHAPGWMNQEAGVLVQYGYWQARRR
jgi:SAM-dependent methyltransferase